MKLTTREIARVGAMAVAGAAVAASFVYGPQAHAEAYSICPSGLSGVATPDTSCAFADSVYDAYYTQPGMTIFAFSPVTRKFYTLQCSLQGTTTWYSAKRCFGINDAGVPLVVYVA